MTLKETILSPLQHLGALGFWLFWLLAASGLYLYLRLDTSAAGAYRSIGELEWWFGGVLRSLHRYAADAFVMAAAGHLIMEIAKGRFRGFRAFSWISGVPLLWLLYASGVVGYWLVWDARSQFSALATAEWFHAAGIGAEPMARNFLGAGQVADRLFSLFVFLHIGLPLALLAGMWIHVQRLGRPATVAPRAHAWGLLAALLALALMLPAKSMPRWDPAVVPQDLAIDWFLQFLHPLMYGSSPGALWALVLAATAFLVFLPFISFIPRTPQIIAARVSPANCSGCGHCVSDCPYAAIELIGQKAHVLAERCAACGVCAGACPSSTPFRSARELVSGIDLPDFTVQDLRRSVRAATASGAKEVVFSCEENRIDHAIGLRCLAMLPPSFVEYALRNGARSVKAVGCAECAYRLGLALSAERFASVREPHLRATVLATRKDYEYTFALR